MTAETTALASTGRYKIFASPHPTALGQGLVPAEAVDDSHSRLASLVGAVGGRLEGFLVCPHTSDARCDCRKPAPGLFLRAERELGVDLAGAVMVGDQPSDVAAAEAAGCQVIVVDPSGREGVKGHLRVGGLVEAAELICAG